MNTAHGTRRLRVAAVLAWLRMARVYQKISGRSEQFFRAQQLNTAQFDVLAQIGGAPGLSQQDLARALLVTKGNISQLLAKMEQEGLVRREQQGRTNCLYLTQQGQQIFGTVVPLQEALIADALAPLTETEQAELLRLLRKLDQALDV